MDDQHTLLEKAKAYDEKAIGELYDQYAPLIYNYLYHRVHNAQVAEDLTGDVFVRVLQAIQSSQFWHTSFRSWLYRIAHNLAIDYYRRQPTHPATALPEDLAGHEDDPDSAIAKQATKRRLHHAIRSLTPDQQLVLSLRFGEQLSAREVAEIMNKSIGAVEVQQHRALASLRRILEKEDR
ncbi:MAG: sigma-70 family RNA polymerase sigma factor [Anaerolineae bacterium]|nr:sigma-70 family RNA polymerase sigma factor [Anaerolineae bacterium]